MRLKWKKEAGIPGIQAPISHGGDYHDYVISHRPDQHTVSYRPAGKHVHVGTFASEKEARRAAEEHARSGSPLPKPSRWLARRGAIHSSGSLTKRKRGRASPRQLDRDIASSFAASGQPQLAAMFADPAARAVFASEMRHEIQKKQASQKTAAALAARPYVVKHLEGGRRALFGRYATEAEARAAADAHHGWVEHGGRVVHGTAKEP